MQPIDGLKIFSELTATGALIWVVYYMLSKSVPDIIARFTEESRAARSAFLDELKNARSDFRAEIQSEREHCRDELQAIRDVHAASVGKG